MGAAEGWGNPAADAPHLAPRLPAAVSARRWLHGQLTPPRAPGAAAALAALHPRSPQVTVSNPYDNLNPCDALTPGPRALGFPLGDPRNERLCAAGYGESKGFKPSGLGLTHGAAAPLLRGIAALARRLGAARATLQGLADPEGLGPPEAFDTGVEHPKADSRGSPAVHLEARADACACAARAPSASGTSCSSSLDASPGAGALICARPRAVPRSTGARGGLVRAQLGAAAARDAAVGNPSTKPRVAAARSGFLRRPLPRLDAVSPSASMGSPGESCARGAPWGEGSRGGARGGYSKPRSAIQALYGPVDGAEADQPARSMSPGESCTRSDTKCAKDSQGSGCRADRANNLLSVTQARARCDAGGEALSANSAVGGERRGSPQRRRRRRLLRRVAGCATAPSLCTLTCLC